MRKQVKLLENHAHFLPDFVDIHLGRIDHLVIHINLALCHLFKQIQASEEGTLSRARRTNHDDDLPRRYMLVNPI